MGFVSWLRYCTDIAQRRSTRLCTMFGHLLGWYTIYTFWGALASNGILPGAKFTLRPSLAFFYIGSITAWHSSSGRQPSFAMWSHMELQNFRSSWFLTEGTTYIPRAAITLGYHGNSIINHHPHSSLHLKTSKIWNAEF